MPRIIAPYGSWPSTITSALLTASGVSLSQLWVDGDRLYWAEGRPLEGGRVAIIQDGEDVLPRSFNARSRVHEYGGTAWAVHSGALFFTNFSDQRIYRHDVQSGTRPITPEPVVPGSLRYADLRVTPDGATLVCVRERHEEGREAINELVVLPTDGSREPSILAGGHDFYASPRISPDGRKLAWLTWDHPNMPWDGTELGTATFDGSRLSGVEKRAGGPGESIFQPEWSPNGVLHHISDKTGWWNLYVDSEPLYCPMEAEFGLPQWIFGLSRYGFLSDGRLATIYTRDGRDHLAILDCATGALETLQVPYTAFSDIQTDGKSTVFFIAGSASLPMQIVALDTRDRSTRVLKSSMNISIPAEDIAVPESIEFPTTRGRTAHALYYSPRNKNYEGPPNEKPPLIVMSHSGPTSSASSNFKLSLQYWTNRGFAVVDVDYGGSTGYGRAYREELAGLWGLVDVEDCIAAVRYLADRGSIDPKRTAIRGGSAGGYTTLCALVFHNTFAAGASHYGVGDLMALASDTHKFESRYLDKLIGPYPAAATLYHDRSPIHFADRLSCPVILFQGLDDKVVPPNQAETFAASLRAKGLACEYVAFPGEGHGFRKAETIQRVAEEELRFYARVFGIKLPGQE
jgi:dipeptidyl aminopeptidase/acylaminoacyl peptidase